MSLFQSIEHVFASVAQDVVKTARFVDTQVLPALQRANASAPLIEAITGLASPQAANVERVAFASLGAVIKAIQDAEAAGNAGGLSVALDATLVADIKAIAPVITAAAVSAKSSVSSSTPKV